MIVNKIFNEDALHGIAKLPDDSVDCVVTSPPYYGLRNYDCDNVKWDNWEGQLGQEPSYEIYLEHLISIAEELKRVLKPTGTLFWNMGDSYAGNMGKRSGWQDHKYSATREEGIKNGTSLFLQADYGDIQSKSLMMIPERFALKMIDIGFILRNKIIWYKRNGMPTSVKDRFSNKWEYVYFFTKSRKYYFDLDSVRKPFSQESIKRRQQKKVSINMQKFEGEGAYKRKHSGYKNTDGSNRINENGANPGDVIKVAAVRHKSWYSYRTPNYPHTRIYDPDADGGDFHDVPTRPHSFAHFAVYPESLVEPLIKAGCPKGGVVLDPFAGSGTTGAVAEVLGRNSILIEISTEYVEIINERLKPKNLEKIKKLLEKKKAEKSKKAENTENAIKMRNRQNNKLDNFIGDEK